MNEIMQRRRALMGASGEKILTGIITVETGNKITIPAKADQNFICINLEAVHDELVGGELITLYRLLDMTSSVYRTRAINVANTSPGMDTQVSNMTQGSDAITGSFTNGNTSGYAVVGKKYRYFIW